MKFKQKNKMMKKKSVRYKATVCQAPLNFYIDKSKSLDKLKKESVVHNKV